MKRLLSLLLCLVLCASMLPAAHAENSLCLTAEGSDGVLTLTVTATEDMVDCCGVRLKFTAPEGFVYVDGSVVPHPGFSDKEMNGEKLIFFMDNPMQGFLLAAGEPILTIQLTIPENAEPGSYSFSVEIPEAYDIGLDDYSIAGQSAETTYSVPFPPPVILEQPQSVTAVQGTTVSFSVVTDAEEPSYCWYYRTGAEADWKACTGGSAATLSVEAKSYRNGYQYRCEVSARGSSIFSDVATLTVITLPRFTQQPQSVTAAAGETVSFTVKVTGSVSSLQWQYRTSESGSWSKCSNGTEATLTIEAKSYRNGYQYRCTATNEAGTAASEVATLTVQALVKPVITAQPQSVAVMPGKTVNFTVTAEGATSYQWYYRTSSSGSWSKSSNGEEATLTIESKIYRNGYQYRCKVSNAAGYVYSSAATMTVAEKPTITGQPSSCTLAVGKTATFTVTAEGADSYQWYYRTSSSGAWTKCSNGTEATLTIEAKSYRSGYQYRCKVTNAVGSVYSSAATLTVK
ncbi:MAG: immunoglobulin domain-containing protein [Oscillospiraceae bacterium]|nr:immunoglobulin domain-containing protein [Oscillospiraceae bacterium]